MAEALCEIEEVAVLNAEGGCLGIQRYLMKHPCYEPACRQGWRTWCCRRCAAEGVARRERGDSLGGGMVCVCVCIMYHKMWEAGVRAYVQRANAVSVCKQAGGSERRKVMRAHLWKRHTPRRAASSSTTDTTTSARYGQKVGGRGAQPLKSAEMMNSMTSQ
jgi:hypothetical protein